MDPTLQYLLLVYGGCLGVYQIAAAAGNFKGLWFFRNSLFTLICGFVILAITFIWFFQWGDVKMNSDPNNPEVEGAQQLGFFLLGAFLALVTMFIVSSIVNFRGVTPDKEPVIGEGLEDLKGRSVYQAFTYRWKNRKRDE